MKELVQMTSRSNPGDAEGEANISEDCRAAQNCLTCNGKKSVDHQWEVLGMRKSPQCKSQMRLTQIKLNHCQPAEVLLSQTNREKDIDVAIFSEPYRNHGDGL